MYLITCWAVKPIKNFLHELLNFIKVWIYIGMMKLCWAVLDTCTKNERCMFACPKDMFNKGKVCFSDYNCVYLTVLSEQKKKITRILERRIEGKQTYLVATLWLNAIYFFKKNDVMYKWYELVTCWISGSLNNF